MMQMIALITGCSRQLGLGFAVARQLAQEGHSVAVTAREIDKVSELAQQLRKDNLDVQAMTLNVTDQESILDCATQVKERYGALDVLINNAVAGFDPEQSIIDQDMTIVRKALETNLIGPWQVCNAFLPLLRQSLHPRIVNVSSGAGLFSKEGLQHPFLTGYLSAYSISKSALNAYTFKLADALRKERVLVNAVDPGQTATHPETGDEAGARPASESAKWVVWAATLPDDGPTGVFFRDGQRLDW